MEISYHGRDNRPMDLDRARLRVIELVADRETDNATVSRAIGKNHAYLHQYLKQNTPRELPEEVREDLAQYFGNGVRPDEFRSKPRNIGESLVSRHDLMKIGGEEYALLPVFDLRLSAGPGAWNGDESEPLRWEPHRHQWLRSISNAAPEYLMLARVDGDSMETTLFSGDQVLIDRTRRALSADGIYGYRVAEEMHVKRISVNPRTRLVTIISDNKSYIPYRNVNPDDLNVIGRIIWLGRQV
ncbi:MAG: helix-turn-helix transcriptional regulator [Patescibacteria group bacterium]|nr:helix-turn-helix transcriptional regulator [Patescibacteria group bacterium]